MSDALPDASGRSGTTVIGNKIHAAHRQDLGIDYFKYPQITHLKTTVNFIKEVYHQHIQANDYLITSVKASADDLLMGIKFIPDIAKSNVSIAMITADAKNMISLLYRFAIFHFFLQ